MTSSITKFRIHLRRASRNAITDLRKNVPKFTNRKLRTIRTLRYEKQAPGKEGGRTRVTYFGRKWSFLRPRHVRKFVKEGYFFVPRYKVKGGGGGKNTPTIHEIYAALTPSDSQSDLASEFAAANCCRLTSSDINVNPTYFPVSVFILLLRR